MRSSQFLSAKTKREEERSLKREGAQRKADDEEKKKKKKHHLLVRFLTQSCCLTIVAGASHVLNQQRPRPAGVLIPGVGGHEGPVVETLRRVIMRPAARAQAAH